MTNLIAIAQKEGKIPIYLINGKELPVIEWHKKTTELQDWFDIKDDYGPERYCLALDGLNWTICRMTIFERIKYLFL